MYARLSPAMEAEGLAALREECVAGLTGDVVEIGAGNGRNFRHYPPTVTSVLAVEPEPHLRSLARVAARQAPVTVSVVPGRAERLPVADATADAGVVTLVLCALDEQVLALRELHRVIRSGGQLRFLEHVAADGPGLRLIQRAADATVWPALTGGCRTHRDPIDALEQAGFRLVAARHLRFPPDRRAIPAAPHVLGVAQRR